MQNRYSTGLRTADAFPVVASPPPIRERNDDRKCVCCSQATIELVLQQCCKTSYMIFGARFSVPERAFPQGFAFLRKLGPSLF